MSPDLMLCSDRHGEVAYVRLNTSTMCPACEALDEQKGQIEGESETAMDILRTDKDKQIDDLQREIDYLNQRIAELENP